MRVQWATTILPGGAGRRWCSAALVAALVAFSPDGRAAGVGAEATRAEARINRMHEQLQITGPQEDQWKLVARVLRDNALSMEPLVRDRDQRAATMSAIDDLNTQAAIADANAVGIRRFTVAFESLYAEMADSQKRLADGFFRNGMSDKLPPK